MTRIPSGMDTEMLSHYRKVQASVVNFMNDSSFTRTRLRMPAHNSMSRPMSTMNRNFVSTFPSSHSFVAGNSTLVYIPTSMLIFEKPSNSTYRYSRMTRRSNGPNFFWKYFDSRWTIWWNLKLNDYDEWESLVSFDLFKIFFFE